MGTQIHLMVRGCYDGAAVAGGGGGGRDALEWKGPQSLLQRRLEEIAKAVGGGYGRLQMRLRLALGVKGTVAGHRLGALEGGGGGHQNASRP